MGQKRFKEDSTNEGDPLVALSFPVDASAYSNFGAILPKWIIRSWWGRSMSRRLPLSSLNRGRSRL
ncbi:hypothetical protein ACOSQ3_018973 [Xanthoceras sorbifolium]